MSYFPPTIPTSEEQLKINHLPMILILPIKMTCGYITFAMKYN